MPWSGGVYTRGYPSWTNDANNNLAISASKFDTEDNDFAAGLNNCLTIDGLNKPTATLNWSQIIALTRGTDGTLLSLARTGGTHNPAFTASVTDSTSLITFQTSNGLYLFCNPLQAYGPTVTGPVDLTPDTGTFTGTFTGFTSNPTGTCTWARIGKLCLLTFPNMSTITGASNATTFTMTGLPAAIQPATLDQMISLPPSMLINNTAPTTGQVTVTHASGTLTFGQNGANTWTASGTKGFSTSFTQGFTFAYLLT